MLRWVWQITIKSAVSHYSIVTAPEGFRILLPIYQAEKGCAPRSSSSDKMFKKFDEKESISGITQLKSSVQKGIRNKVREIDGSGGILAFLKKVTQKIL